MGDTQKDWWLLLRNKSQELIFLILLDLFFGTKLVIISVGTD